MSSRWPNKGKLIVLITIIGAINYQRIVEGVMNMRKQKINTLMETVLIGNLFKSKIKSLCVFGNRNKVKC